MQEAIIQIGSAVLEDGSMLSSLIQEVPVTKGGKQLHIVKFNYKTKDNTLVIDAKEEMKESSSNEYMFIGSASGAASPQWFATSTSSIYHLTETFCNLSKMDFGQELNEKIQYILKEYYVDLGENLKSKVRYALNFRKFGMSEIDIKEAYEEIKAQENDEKVILDKLKKLPKKLFDDYIKENYGLKDKDIALYTILIDDVPLSNFNEYKTLAINSKTEGKSKSKPKSKDKITLSCSVCNAEESSPADLAKMNIKFFTTNQIIFANNLNVNNYHKNMILCQKCLNKIISGEIYIKNNLNTRLSGFNVYLIPHFILGESLTKDDLDYVSDKISTSFNTVKNFKEVEDLKKEIQYLSEENESYYLLNIVFYKLMQKATKVQMLIKDVNPSIFEHIRKASLNTYKIAKEVISEEYKYITSLESIYYITPIRINNKSEAQQYKKLLQIYNAIFTRKKINKEFIIDNILETVRIQQFEKEGFNIKGGYINNTIIEGNMCIKFLEELGCIEEGEGMDTLDLKLKDDIKTYIQKMKYNEQQVSMFLLGYLIGQVGREQYKRTGDKKPVLNKLNFGGIDKGKILRLTNDIFNKLRQEKILKYNETIFSECKRLIDNNLVNWNMNKHENLFYILSGYGYVTTKNMSKKDGGSDHE